MHNLGDVRGVQVAHAPHYLARAILPAAVAVEEFEFSYLSEDSADTTTTTKTTTAAAATVDEYDGCVMVGTRLRCEDGRLFEVDTNGYKWPISISVNDVETQEVAEEPKESGVDQFKIVLTEMMNSELGDSVDPLNGQQCLTSESA